MFRAKALRTNFPTTSAGIISLRCSVNVVFHKPKRLSYRVDVSNVVRFWYKLCYLDIIGSGVTLFSFFGFVLLTSETEWTHDGKCDSKRY
jgi:hypothetical protein